MLPCAVKSRLHLCPAGPFRLLFFIPLFPLLHPSPLLPVVYALFRSFLHFFALSKNLSLFFSCNSALFHKNNELPYLQQTLFPDLKFLSIRISQIEDQNETPNR